MEGREVTLGLKMLVNMGILSQPSSFHTSFHGETFTHPGLTFLTTGFSELSCQCPPELPGHRGTTCSSHMGDTGPQGMVELPKSPTSLSHLGPLYPV